MLKSSVKGGGSLRVKTSILQGEKSQDPHSLQEGSVCDHRGRVGFRFKIHLIKGLIVSGSQL